MSAVVDLEVQRSLGRIEAKVEAVVKRLMKAEDCRREHGLRLSGLEHKFWWATGALVVLSSAGHEIVNSYFI